MENNKQNEVLQITNLVKELNNNIVQINDRILKINNIINQLNNIMLNYNKINKIDNFMQMMNSFKINFNDYKFQSDKNDEPKFVPMKKVNEDEFEEEAIVTVMEEGKCTREEAIKALRKHNGDPVEALLEVGKEEELNKEDFNQDHEILIEAIMKEGFCSRENAIKALKNHNWDPVEALLEVQNM